jgi:hypothetical protein
MTLLDHPGFASLVAVFVRPLVTKDASSWFRLGKCAEIEFPTVLFRCDEFVPVLCEFAAFSVKSVVRYLGLRCARNGTPGNVFRVKSANFMRGVHYMIEIVVGRWQSQVPWQ